MTNLDSKMSKEEAQKSLEALRGYQQSAQQAVKTFWWHSLFSAIFYGLAVYSFSATRHENNWALGIIVGVIGFILVNAFAYYCYRLMGVRLRMMPRDRRSNYFLLAVGVFFGVLFHLTRWSSQAGMDWAAILITVFSSILMFYLMNKFPTGELPPKGVVNE